MTTGPSICSASRCRLLRAPLIERREDFDQARCGLPEVAAEVWRSFLFVNLDGHASPLAPRLEGLVPLVRNYHMEDMVLGHCETEASRRAVPALSSITTKVPSAASAVISMKPEATERSVPPSMMVSLGSNCSMEYRSVACRSRSSPIRRARPSSSAGATESESAGAASDSRYSRYLVTVAL